MRAGMTAWRAVSSTSLARQIGLTVYQPILSRRCKCLVSVLRPSAMHSMIIVGLPFLNRRAYRIGEVGSESRREHIVVCAGLNNPRSVACVLSRILVMAVCCKNPQTFYKRRCSSSYLLFGLCSSAHPDISARTPSSSLNPGLSHLSLL